MDQIRVIRMGTHKLRIVCLPHLDTAFVRFVSTLIGRSAQTLHTTVVAGLD